MHWINLVQDSNQWRHLVNTAINFRVPKMLGIFAMSEKLKTSQETFLYMKLLDS
jgi:hypothetical protein